MTGKGNKSVQIRCPLCGRQPVPTKRGRISSHLNPGGVRCSASGLSAHYALLFQKEKS